jgi:translation initiation factor IF-2
MLEIKHRGDAAMQQAAKEKKEKKPEEDESKHLVARPPVVCILGHVDHGKTSLLDAIRKANVAAGEAGGITQHIGAYQIEYNNRKITFLDTPGHAAFTKMRARGASVTDIAVLVVAADDGFMPQTDEALKIALAEKQNHAERFALVVAVNKMDVKGANLDQVKNQMQQRGIAPEDWGGETITVPVAAIKNQGINDLLEMILLQADVLELKANPKAEASGVVIESEIDFGRGPLATVIVQRGTLRVGDAIVSGPNYAKVRAMFDDQGKNLKEAPPAMPVRVIGWSGTPDSGAGFRVVKNAREAEKLAEEEQLRIKKAATTAAAVPKEVSVEQLFANIAATQAKALKVIVKTDVFGSSEAVRNSRGHQERQGALEIVSIEVGLVTKNDVLMASAAGAVIIGFHTKLENGVTPLAKHHGVRIESFDIIYEMGDKVREMMADLLDPDIKEIKTGAAEVRAGLPAGQGLRGGLPRHRGQDQPQRLRPPAAGPREWSTKGRSPRSPLQGRRQRGAGRPRVRHQARRLQRLRDRRRHRVLRNPEGPRRPLRRSGPDRSRGWRPALQRSLSDEQPHRARQRARPTRAQRHPAPRYQSEAVAITVSEVRVSPDLRDGRVFVSVVGDEATAEAKLRWLRSQGAGDSRGARPAHRAEVSAEARVRARPSACARQPACCRCSTNRTPGAAAAPGNRIRSELRGDDSTRSFGAIISPAAGRPRGRKVAVVGHARPDGDCIGSQVALARVLRRVGMDVVCVNADPVPRRLQFLVPRMTFLRPTTCCPTARIGRRSFVDCADHARGGERLKAGYPPVAVIDHHLSNTGFATFNLIDTARPRPARCWRACSWTRGFRRRGAARRPFTPAS